MEFFREYSDYFYMFFPVEHSGNKSGHKFGIRAGYINIRICTFKQAINCFLPTFNLLNLIQKYITFLFSCNFLKRDISFSFRPVTGLLIAFCGVDADGSRAFLPCHAHIQQLRQIAQLVIGIIVDGIGTHTLSFPVAV